MIDSSCQVATIAREHPSTVRVFQRRGIDFCCGGKKPLEAACRELGIPVDEVVEELNAVHGRPAEESETWDQRPLAELVDHIVVRYHESLRRELPIVRQLAAKVADRHGDQRPELREIRTLFETLRREMLEHTMKEERVLFPVIVALEAGDRPTVPSIDGPVTAMEDDHEQVGRLLSRLRSLSQGFEPPAGACNSFRGLYQGLADLEADTHVHIHLENNILFPRAQALCGQNVSI